jgi:iron(III) transport system substrate-binding protein
MKGTFYFLWPLVFIFSSCGPDRNEVVVYTSVDQVFSEPVLKAFEQKTGIRVKSVFDTEETKSTGVLNRLINEKENPRCDVFWSGDPMRAEVLKQKQITEPYPSPAASGIDPVFIEKQYHWIGFSSRARVLLINTNRIAAAQAPQSISDLTREKYKGQVAIANPLFGTTSFHMAALFVVWGDEKAKRFLSELKKNKVVIASSNGDVKKKVAAGEVAMGLTDTDDAHEALKEKAPVKVIFLDQDGLGNLIVPNTVSLIKQGPHSANGQKLIDFLLSPSTEKMLAESCAQMPLHKGVAAEGNAFSLDTVRPLPLDYGQAAQKSEQIKQYLKQWAEQ